MGDDVGERFFSVIEIVPFAHIMGKCSHLDEEVEHFIDEPGLSVGVIAVCHALLAFAEPFHQHGKWHVGVSWVN